MLDLVGGWVDGLLRAYCMVQQEQKEEWEKGCIWLIIYIKTNIYVCHDTLCYDIYALQLTIINELTS